MHNRVNELLTQIENEHACRVLFACESGSRAWGFASPDSDYDVRFIYAHPKDWHLRLESKRDTIELMTTDEVDLSGWELTKTLRLFAGCNLALNEWLGSPIVYGADAKFHHALIDLIPHYFNPRKAVHHYLSMSKIANDEQLDAGEISIKKLFYALRCVIACEWVIAHNTMPPTEFEVLVRRMASDNLAAQIDELKALKSRTDEKQPVGFPEEIVTWIKAKRAQAASLVETLPTAEGPGWEPLNELVMTFTKQTTIG